MVLGRTRAQRPPPTSSRYHINPQPPLPGNAPSSLGKVGQTPGPKGAASRTKGAEQGLGVRRACRGPRSRCSPPCSPPSLPGQGSAGESGLWLVCFRQPGLVKRKKGSLSRGRGSNPVMCLREKRGQRSEEDRPGTDANSLPFAPRVPCQPLPSHKRPPPLLAN